MFAYLGTASGLWFDAFAIAGAALLLDALIGDPGWLYRRLPHPVALIGRAIGGFDRLLNRPTASAPLRVLAGILTVLIVAGAVGALAWAIGSGLRKIEPPWIGAAVEAVLVSVLLAGRSLHAHVAAVARGLAQNLADGRKAVAAIVGRDPETLDEAGVARAAIESAAENFSDGLIAPLFWYVLFGLPGIAAYKAINTLDSMIGHRTDRHRAFGWAAARLDDLVNLIPARLAGGLLALGALLIPWASARRALATMIRDAGKHRSVNAGWPEAAMAGALGLSLGGPRHYTGDHADDPWIGAGTRNASLADIRRALTVNLATGLWLALVLAAGFGISFAVVS
ncbi:MAG: adenosylcobinamide-phosphate synthase CbiB [Alphaproteobacteria bacterium]